MYDMDAGLVIFPSVLRRCYIIARRRAASLKWATLVKLNDDLVKMSAHGDGDVLAANSIVFVETLIGWDIWTDQPLRELRQRDMWRAGGADAYNAKLLATEQAAKDAERKTLDDNLDHRARDGWRSYQARTGQRNQRGLGSFKPATIVPVGTL